MYFITSEKVDFVPGEKLILPGTEIPSNIFSPDGFGIDQVSLRIIYNDDSLDEQP